MQVYMRFFVYYLEFVHSTIYYLLLCSTTSLCEIPYDLFAYVKNYPYLCSRKGLNNQPSLPDDIYLYIEKRSKSKNR